ISCFVCFMTKSFARFLIEVTNNFLIRYMFFYILLILYILVCVILLSFCCSFVVILLFFFSFFVLVTLPFNNVYDAKFVVTVYFLRCLCSSEYKLTRF